jgi:hypothetical protein
LQPRAIIATLNVAFEPLQGQLPIFGNFLFCPDRPSNEKAVHVSAQAPSGHKGLTSLSTRRTIDNELFRLQATDIHVMDLDPDAGVLQLSLNKNSCNVQADGLCKMLQSLNDASGSHAVMKAVRKSAGRGERWAMW